MHFHLFSEIPHDERFVLEPVGRSAQPTAGATFTRRYVNTNAVRHSTRKASAAVCLVVASALIPAQTAFAQMGGGGQQQGSTSPPAASLAIKKNLDRSDPLNFLLERKKPLDLNKTVEDSIKLMRKEMQRMQEVIYKDLDKAASTKERGELPSATIILTLTKDSEERVKDIQAAYRDRARLMLDGKQLVRADSLEVDWKRTLPRAEPLAVKRPPAYP